MLRGADHSYSDSHSTTDVYISGTGIDKFVLQDATYNIVGRTGTSTHDYYSVPELFYFVYGRAAAPVFSNGGEAYAVNDQRWAYNATGFVEYFKGLYSFWPSWAY